MTDSSKQHCTLCGGPTRYMAFSGGQEWECLDLDGCGMSGLYPDGEPVVRANLLRTPEGREALRTQMREHLATRKTEK